MVPGSPTLSLHDAFPISKGETGTSAPMVIKDKVLIGISGGEFGVQCHMTAYDLKSGRRVWRSCGTARRTRRRRCRSDRKSTRLNSRHLGISYAVLCLKKK